MCPVCGWQNLLNQLRWPDSPSAVNPTLIESQLKHARRERDGLANSSGYARDKGWRLIDPAKDDFEPMWVQEAALPDDPMALYYWRPTFWRRQDRRS